MRNRLGNFKNFDAVPGGATLMGTQGINLSGEVAGYYGDATTLVTHCFLRDAMGSITDFDIPGSSASIASGINDAGLIVGYWMVENQVLVDSFERDAAGGISTFAAPTDNYGTFAASINEKHQVTGNWQDSIDFVYHGFVQKRDRLLCEKVSAACCLCAGAPAATPIEGSVAVIAHCVQGRGRSIQIATTAQS